MCKQASSIVFFFLLLNTGHVFGQLPSTVVYPDIIVQASGILIDLEMKEDTAKRTEIPVAGGYLDIEFSLSVWTTNRPLYFVSTQPNNTRSTIRFNGKETKDMREPTNLIKLYLKVGDEFTLEKYDQATDSLLKTYVIRRVKVLPEIELSRVDQDNKQVYARTSVPDSTNKVFTISEGALDIKSLAEVRFKDGSISFNLLNLKTKKIENIPMHGQFAQVLLEANTDYELRFSYQVQAETGIVFYVKVKPHWYQSLLFYAALLLFFALIAIAVIVVISRRRLRKSKMQQTEMEQAALRLQGQLNPHFTFNALSSIQGLMNTNRIEEANDYLEQFSSLLRQTLAGSNKIFNRLDAELQMMETYIKLESLRFNFEWEIEVDANIQPTEIEIPTLIIQPLIENAIRHGISGLGKDGRLSIHCKKGVDPETLMVIVKDNGQWQERKSSSGFGLTLTEERIRSINKLSDTRNIELTMDRKFGTKATLLFYHWI